MTDTHDISIPDVTSEEAAIIVVGVSYVMMQAADHRSKERVVQAGELQVKILEENPDVYRHAFLDGDVGDHIHVEALPDDVLDLLGLELIDGKLYDADRMTDIDVEDG